MGEQVDWPTAAVLIAIIFAVMVIASTYISTHGQKP
jgi:preprotein translocase subunit Sec61beta